MLKDLRAQYLEKQDSSKDVEETGKGEIFTPISKEEKRNKVIEGIHLLDEKKLSLSNKLKELHQHKNNSEKISKLKHQIESLKYKESLLKQKLEYIDSGESEFVKKEKLKRQLTELELKRCRALLSKKDCNKINQKINQKKELLKKIK